MSVFKGSDAVVAKETWHSSTYATTHLLINYVRLFTGTRSFVVADAQFIVFVYFVLNVAYRAYKWALRSLKFPFGFILLRSRVRLFLTHSTHSFTHTNTVILLTWEVLSSVFINIQFICFVNCCFSFGVFFSSFSPSLHRCVSSSLQFVIQELTFIALVRCCSWISSLNVCLRLICTHLPSFIIAQLFLSHKII